MDNSFKLKARRKLTNYLEQRFQKRTPARYNILDTAYDMEGLFSMDELNQRLGKKGFNVCRATLYNTLNLFIELQLIIKHNFSDGVRYEACLKNENNCNQICTFCGKVTELTIPGISSIIKDYKFRKFRKSEYKINVYGICSTCQAKQTRRKTEHKKKLRQQNG